MARFVISPHFRLHEWVAEEKGYFKAEGLDYEFRNVFESHATPDKVGAYTSFEKGRETNISCACHWTVNVAASSGHGKLYADAYSVAPAAVFVPPDSAIRNPEDLRGVPISVGHQSGSHYSTLQALEQYMPLADIKLSFADGILFSRLEKLIDRQVPAAALFSGPYYFLEQLGFRGPGERIVFEPYTKEVFEDAFRWVREHKIFEPAAMGAGCYEDACVSLSAH